MGNEINGAGQVPFNASQIARQLDAQDGKVDGKINSDVWNSYANQNGGKNINKYININDAIRSINVYHNREQAAIEQVKKEVKFEPPEIKPMSEEEMAELNNPPQITNKSYLNQLAEVQAAKDASSGGGQIDEPVDGGELFGGKDVVIRGNRHDQKDAPIDGGIPWDSGQDVVIRGNRHDQKDAPIDGGIPWDNGQDVVIRGNRHDQKDAPIDGGIPWDSGQDVVIRGNRHDQKDAPIDGGIPWDSGQDVVIRGNRHNQKDVPIDGGIPWDSGQDVVIRGDKSKSTHKTYGAPNKTLAETDLMAMVQNGQLKAGDVVYVHQNAATNGASKIVMTSPTEWQQMDL